MMNLRKKYRHPELEVIEFGGDANIVTASTPLTAGKSMASQFSDESVNKSLFPSQP